MNYETRDPNGGASILTAPPEFFVLATNTAQKVVEVSDLRKEFNGVYAIDGLSFHVAEGEILGMLGPNGAGKTTAIQIMLGLITPSSGTVRLFGMDFEKHRIKILQRCNFSSAYVNLPHNLRVWENLTVFASIYSVKNAKKKIDDLLEMFEIAHLRKVMTGRLSSGEQTRVNLCS
jgi:ABC-2 type transport system ATP-binding protein